MVDAMLPADIISLLESGKITVSENGERSVEVRAKDHEIKVDIVSLPSSVPAASRVLTTLSEARGLARSLNERGVTLTVCSASRPVIKMGRSAKPGMSRLLTRSGDVEVTDLRELRRLDRRLRAADSSQH